jgi:hypothetical protein
MDSREWKVLQQQIYVSGESWFTDDMAGPTTKCNHKSIERQEQKNDTMHSIEFIVVLIVDIVTLGQNSN